ncbi:ribonuclease P protein component [Legionella spiritensis]|uniref:ribonuclease P protein component n=1 Tax=Legionella spiritensis TaxID=452 RepID=UPI001E435497|nr:ribonuclease P protein component [Legionella spiritensis]
MNKKEFDAVFNQPGKTVTPELVVLHKANNLGYARLGMALSKKMIPKACERNRLKRLIRESFRTGKLPAVDIIVLARYGVAEAGNRKITSRLGLTWDKLIALYAG